MTKTTKSTQYWMDRAPLILEWISMAHNGRRTVCTMYDAHRITNSMSYEYPYGIEGIGSVVATAIKLGIIQQGDE